MNNRRTIQTDGTAAWEKLKAEINREELVEQIARVVSEDGTVEPIKGLRLNRASIKTGLIYGVAYPSFCVIAQGSKEMHLGEERYRYDPSHYLLATVELPVVSQIAEASPERPSVPEPTTGPRFSTGCLRDAGGRHASPPKGPAAFLFPQILQIVFLHKIGNHSEGLCSCGMTG